MAPKGAHHRGFCKPDITRQIMKKRREQDTACAQLRIKSTIYIFLNLLTLSESSPSFLSLSPSLNHSLILPSSGLGPHLLINPHYEYKHNEAFCRYYNPLLPHIFLLSELPHKSVLSLMTLEAPASLPLLPSTHLPSSPHTLPIPPPPPLVLPSSPLLMQRKPPIHQHPIPLPRAPSHLSSLGSPPPGLVT